MPDKLDKKRLGLPDKPGVYLMKNAAGKVIYVGKAKSLKKRVNSYFRANSQVGKVLSMMAKLHTFDYIVTATELDALVLEVNLIKKYRPYYNIELKEDQRYPYLKITVRDRYPRIISTRYPVKDSSLYFGPYPRVGAVGRTLDMIRKVFRLRSCKTRIRRGEACLNFHIQRCFAPCEGLISEEDYRKLVNQVILFLRGRNDSLLKQLRQQMKSASNNLNFEQALLLRDQIQALENTSAQQIITELKNVDADIIALEHDVGHHCVVVLLVRAGKILGEKHFFLKRAQDNTEAELMKTFIGRYYFEEEFLPRIIMVSSLPSEKKLLEDWLSGRKNSGVRINQPQRGRYRSLLKMAAANGRIFLSELWAAEHRQDMKPALESLQKKLKLRNYPGLITCIDISHTGGEQAVGSLVAFSEGKKDPGNFRRYRVKSVKGIDDYAMIEEVTNRYLTRVAAGEVARPDLIVIDGGKGQLSAALSALQRASLNDIDILSLAKREEEIFQPGSLTAVSLSKKDAELLLLMKVRDEAHRFAHRYHRQQRDKRIRGSVLDLVKGIGPQRKKELLRHFGSLKRIRAASPKQLAQVKGISISQATRLYDELKKL